MTPVTVSNLLCHAKTLENSQLVTLRRKKPFRIKVIAEGITILPGITRKPRRVTRNMIREVCDEFQSSKSMKPGDYKNITFDASYILAMIDGFLREKQ